MSRIFIIKKKQKGFTLIEILLVMLITSVLVLGVNAAFRQAHILWSRAETKRLVYQKTRIFFDILQNELSCLYMPKFGEEQQQSIPFSLSIIPDGTVRLSFFTMNPAWGDTFLSNLPAKVSYEFTTDSNSGRVKLSRTEQLFSGEKTVTAEQKETILEGFSGVVVQAADLEAESTTGLWKTDIQCNQSPPRAVKILLKWQMDGQEGFEFETIIKIACQGQLIPP